VCRDNPTGTDRRLIGRRAAEARTYRSCRQRPANSLDSLPSAGDNSRSRSAMRHFLFSWTVRVVLAALLVHTIAVFLPSDTSQVRPFAPASALTSSQQIDPAGSLFQKPPSVSEELSLRCVRESKSLLALARSCDLAPRAQGQDSRPKAVPVPVSFSPAFSFPRKLSPPSASDDPFLN
jgi:hypothetical protein